MGPEEGGAKLEISQKQAQQVENKKYEGLEAVWVFLGAENMLLQLKCTNVHFSELEEREGQACRIPIKL